MFTKVKGSSKRLRFNLSPAPLSSVPHCFSFLKFYGQFDVIPFFFTINLNLISSEYCCRVIEVVNWRLLFLFTHYSFKV